MKVISSILVIAVFLFPCASAMAASRGAAKPEEYYRSCSDTDLVGGAWKLVVLKETPELKEAEEYKHIPYQYIAFYSDHQYATLSIDRKVQASAQAQRLMTSLPPGKQLPKYTLDNTSKLDLYRDKNIEYSYRCVMINGNNVHGYQKGDMTLTGYTREKSQIFKSYRRF